MTENIIRIPGSEAWVDAYDVSGPLETKFPSVDIDQLCYAIANNYPKELTLEDLAQIEWINLAQQGEHDGESWRWYLKLQDGRKFDVEGWCDYTGWDCQSGMTVKEVV